MPSNKNKKKRGKTVNANATPPPASANSAFTPFDHHNIIIFGIGGSSRPSVVPGRKAIIQNLNSRSNLNGNHCTVQKILKNGRIAITKFNNVTATGLPELQELDEEVIAVLPSKLEMVWELNKKKDDEDEVQEVCPICIDTPMIINDNASRFACCGGMICNRCYVQCVQSKDPDRCPLCRADTSDCSDAAELAKIQLRANRGDPNACYNLGGYYDYGGKYGLEQDQTKARYWYQIAAQKGEVRAAQNLGCCFRDGEGGPIDLVEAATYFRMAAEGGHIPGMTNYGLSLMRGDGVPQQDFKEAKKWLSLAAKKGDQLAVQQLTVLQYMMG